jgi:hypothetical protein
LVLNLVSSTLPCIRRPRPRLNYQYVSLAVDGQIGVAHQSNTGNFFITECNKPNEWFMLDLESEYEIASVRIFNMEPFALVGAEIRVGNVDSFDGNPACASNFPGDSTVITVTCGALPAPPGRSLLLWAPLAGSTDESACFCKPGYGQVSSAIASCETCVAGTYSEGRCFNKDEGVSGWDGICADLEDGHGQECASYIQYSGMPPDMCCICMEAFPFEEHCTACPAGTFSDVEGASSCSQCEPGMFENATGSSACKMCAANADSLPGSPNERSCFCKAGFFGDGTSCKACQAGKYTFSHTAAFLTEKANPPEASRSYSSVYDNHAPGTGFARSILDSGDAWCAGGLTAGNEWMKIDLELAMRVDGVVLQARHDHDQYLTEVEVQHSLDPNSGFSSVQSQANGGVRFFPTATNSNKQKSELIFMEPVVARYIKIVAWSWVSHICTRAGV